MKKNPCEEQRLPITNKWQYYYSTRTVSQAKKQERYRVKLCSYRFYFTLVISFDLLINFYFY